HTPFRPLLLRASTAAGLLSTASVSLHTTSPITSVKLPDPQKSSRARVNVLSFSSWSLSHAPIRSFCAVFPCKNPRSRWGTTSEALTDSLILRETHFSPLGGRQLKLGKLFLSSLSVT